MAFQTLLRPKVGFLKATVWKVTISILSWQAREHIKLPTHFLIIMVVKANVLSTFLLIHYPNRQEQ